MAIYVDTLRECVPNPNWRWSESCHLYTDDDLAELHAFADRLGMRRSWFQDRATLPHYDLTAARRAVALRTGAVYDEDDEVLIRLLRANRAVRRSTQTQSGT